MITADYIVVGSGLTGSTIARLLADAGQDVLVLERRAHAGGNVHDTLHSSGIRVHTYGPHYFRTNSARIWAFANRFGSFYDYAARVLTYVGGRYEAWPLSATLLTRLAGSAWRPSFQGKPTTFEQASLAMMPAIAYNTFIKGYTEKQWGVPGSSLLPDLAKRFEIRLGGDTRLTRHKHQGLPRDGYAKWISAILSDIPVLLGTDYRKVRDDVRPKRSLIYTGPIDELFEFKFGRLKYRGQRREHEYFPHDSYRLPAVQVNNPEVRGGAHIRTVEWKWMMPSDLAGKTEGTVVTREFPFTRDDRNDYAYPFPDEHNRQLYRRYLAELPHLNRVVVCGRLGRYRYLDMDAAIEEAMSVARALLTDRE